MVVSTPMVTTTGAEPNFGSASLLLHEVKMVMKVAARARIDAPAAFV
jgi:hypothetical protein